MSTWQRDLKRIHAFGTSATFVATAGNWMHVNVGPIPNDVILKRLRIIGSGLSTTGSNQMDVKILTDGAAYRYAEGTSPSSGEPYIVFAWNDLTSDAGPNTIWLSDVTFSDDVEFNDDLRSNNLYVRLESAAALTSDAVFRVDFWGDGLPYTNWTPQGNTAESTHPTVWRWSSGNVWTVLDVRNPLDDERARIRLFSADTDYVYFGMPTTWDGLWFNVVDPNTTASLTATWEYWDGSNWSSLLTFDNCIDAHPVQPMYFAYSGVVRWTPPSDWAATDLSTLSLGTPPYDGSMPVGNYGMFPTSIDAHQRTPRYWVRFNLSDITTQPTFKWVRERPVI